MPLRLQPLQLLPVDGDDGGGNVVAVVDAAAVDGGEAADVNAVVAERWQSSTLTLGGRGGDKS